jgi:hypothetical protein
MSYLCKTSDHRDGSRSKIIADDLQTAQYTLSFPLRILEQGLQNTWKEPFSVESSEDALLIGTNWGLLVEVEEGIVAVKYLKWWNHVVKKKVMINRVKAYQHTRNRGEEQFRMTWFKKIFPKIQNFLCQKNFFEKMIKNIIVIGTISGGSGTDR